MKKYLLASALTALMASAALAGTKIGVSMALIDDNFLTVLRNGIEAQAAGMDAEVQIEDAQKDVAKQLDQIKNFAASGVQAIIVNPVDTSATQAMTDAAAAANIPLVYADRIIVFRRGRIAANLLKEETNGRDVVSYITGAKTAPEYADAA
jgi:inositol transport system substrate-binding protein